MQLKSVLKFSAIVFWSKISQSITRPLDFSEPIISLIVDNVHCISFGSSYF